MNIKDQVDKLPEGCYICEKALWCKNICVEIEHTDNDLSKPLNYAKAITYMLEKLEVIK